MKYSKEVTLRTFEILSAKFRILEMLAREHNLVSEPVAYIVIS